MENYKAHILVVDDDDGIRELVKQFLNRSELRDWKLGLMIIWQNLLNQKN